MSDPRRGWGGQTLPDREIFILLARKKVLAEGTMRLDESHREYNGGMEKRAEGRGLPNGLALSFFRIIGAEKGDTINTISLKTTTLSIYNIGGLLEARRERDKLDANEFCKISAGNPDHILHTFFTWKKGEEGSGWRTPTKGKGECQNMSMGERKVSGASLRGGVTDGQARRG